ncbi:MAG: sigma-70 family RNA polymerase sigma factor [Chloroflexota bacterium]|nr:sigma-70 family RNA polymerase sigma factor [Chloroflexota bacterium]
MDGTIAVLPNELTLVSEATTEPTAFAAIYDHYFPSIYNYVRYRVVDADITDDLTAQVFEKALVSLNGYHPERGSFAVWLFTISRNVVNDHLRAKRRRRWLSLDILSGKANTVSLPEETIMQNETRYELLQAMTRLSDRERDLLALKFVAGLRNGRIAELTGLSQSNVGVILYRAIRRLRVELGTLR